MYLISAFLLDKTNCNEVLQDRTFGDVVSVVLSALGVLYCVVDIHSKAFGDSATLAVEDESRAGWKTLYRVHEYVIGSHSENINSLNG